MSQIALNKLQAIGLMEMLGEADEQGVLITDQGTAGVVVATATSTVLITPKGDLKEDSRAEPTSADAMEATARLIWRRET